MPSLRAPHQLANSTSLISPVRTAQSGGGAYCNSQFDGAFALPSHLPSRARTSTHVPARPPTTACQAALQPVASPRLVTFSFLGLHLRRSAPRTKYDRRVISRLANLSDLSSTSIPPHGVLHDLRPCWQYKAPPTMASLLPFISEILPMIMPASTHVTAAKDLQPDHPTVEGPVIRRAAVVDRCDKMCASGKLDHTHAPPRLLASFLARTTHPSHPVILLITPAYAPSFPPP